MSQASYDSIAKILVQPGRLVKAPTNVAIGQSFPYGGTSLGLTDTGVLLSRVSNFKTITAEEYGQEPVRVIYTGEEMTVRVDFLQWSDDVMNAMFNGFTVTGGTSGEKNVEFPGDGTSMYVGKDITDNSFPLLFAPED